MDIPRDKKHDVAAMFSKRLCLCLLACKQQFVHALFIEIQVVFLGVFGPKELVCTRRAHRSIATYGRRFLHRNGLSLHAQFFLTAPYQLMLNTLCLNSLNEIMYAFFLKYGFSSHTKSPTQGLS